MFKKVLIIVLALSIIAFSGLAWASVEGTWDVQGKETVKVSIKGYKSQTQKIAFEDEFTFYGDGSFKMTGYGGTWFQKKKTFTINLNPYEIESLFEELMWEYYKMDVDCYNTKISFKGKENTKTNTIKGQFALKMNLYFYDYGVGGKIQVTTKFQGSRSACIVLNSPNMISPFNGATGVSLTPILDWSDVTGATSYEVQVCTDTGCANVVWSAIVTSSQSTVSPALTPNSIYYWRVRANNSCDTSPWSPIWSFTSGDITITCTPPPSGLISWWPGDGDANDIVDNNHGTLLNGATFGTGLVDEAFQLDGINDFVMVPHSPSLNFSTNDFTIDLWVKFNSTNGEQIIIEKYIETYSNTPRTGWSLTKLSNNVIRFAGPIVGFDNSGSIFDVAPPSIPTNTWIFVAVTRRGNNFTLWWNGVAIGSATLAVNLNTSASLKIGHRGNPTDTPGSLDTRGFYLKGSVDEVEIFNRSLSVTEIQNIFNAGSKGKCKVVGSSGIITGRVTDTYGNGVAKVEVAAHDVNGNWKAGSSTDNNGYYSINIDIGSWIILFNTDKAGYYAPEWYNNKSIFSEAIPVIVVAGQATANINAQLEPGGKITGRVVDSYGNGIANVDVSAHDSNSDWRGGTITDSQGSYSIGVGEGTWKIFFNAERAGYNVSEWYNNKASFNEADPVTVTTGQAISNINAQL
ncbi:MAG: LamG-like jellyroll fold domain-containing protein [Nitrospirota bacterium]